MARCMSPEQRAINARGARMLLAALGRPDTPGELADERQALLALLLRYAREKARGPAPIAAVLEVAGRRQEARDVRRWGGMVGGADPLRAAAREAADGGIEGAMRAKILRWAADRL